jgi:hypothetical protein
MRRDREWRERRLPPGATLNRGPLERIWQGSSTESGATVNTAVLVAEDGSFHAYEENTSTGCAAVLTGLATASGSTVSGTIQAALVSVAENTSIQTTCVYSDGSSWATGYLSGTVVRGSSITIFRHYESHIVGGGSRGSRNRSSLWVKSMCGQGPARR